MAKKKKAKAHKPGKDELSLEGVGVNIPRIAELDDAAAAYQKIKKQRCALTPKEIAAKEVVISLIMAHAADLPKDEEGAIRYRNNELQITMRHGRDSLKVTEINDDDQDDMD